MRSTGYGNFPDAFEKTYGPANYEKETLRMKTMKKFASLALALVLCLSMSVAALAASSGSQEGTITISNPAEGETYSVYQIFEMTYSSGSYYGDSSSYSYRVCDGWEELFADEEFSLFFTIDGHGYLDPESAVFREKENSTVMARFAQAALSFAKEQGMEPADHLKATSSIESLEFTGLDLGYYVVDTSLGSLCMLTSTNPDAQIREKNPTPSNKKYVEDITDKDKEETFVTSDNADVIDRLRYEIILDNVEDLHNLCLHDQIDPELTLDEGTVTVYLNGTENELTRGTVKAGTEYDADGTAVTVYDVEGGAYAVVFAGDELYSGDGCCFEIHFSDSYLAGLTDEDELYVVYEVDIDAADDDFTEDHAELDNTAHVSYGLARTSVPVQTQTYLYGFELFKYTMVNGRQKGLADAQFVLSYVDSRDAAHYATFEMHNGNYVLKDWEGSAENESSFITSVADDNVYIEGLDPDTTYYLTEVAAPDGYNMLKDPITVSFAVDEMLPDSFTVYYDGTQAENHVVPVMNNQGSMLPGTGGMGTTVFYVAGIILILGACVVLITRRRMRKAN